MINNILLLRIIHQFKGHSFHRKAENLKNSVKLLDNMTDLENEKLFQIHWFENVSSTMDKVSIFISFLFLYFKMY
jgi:hypothetical protein